MYLKSNIKGNYKREIFFVALSALFIFLLVACFSYNADDNTLFHFSNQQKTTLNLAGFVGANAAAIIFYLLGQAAFIFLFCLGLTIFLLATNKNLKDIRARLFGNFVFFCSSTVLLTIVKDQFGLSVSGGVLGATLTPGFYFISGTRGSVVIILALLWMSATSLLQIPLFPIFARAFQELKKLASRSIRPLFQIKVLNFKVLNFFKRKKANPTTPDILPAADLGGDVKSDIEYWKSLLDPKIKQSSDVPIHTTPKISIDNDSAKTFEKFKSKKIRTTTEKFGSGKLAPKLVANHILSQNLFTKQIDWDSHLDRTNNAKHSTNAQQKQFVLPDLNFFAKRPDDGNLDDITKEAELCGKKLEEKLLCFGIKGKVVSIKPGPVITMFEYKPEIDSKISKITAMEDDLAMALTAKSIRILAPIPGKNVVGFEISNSTRRDVYFSEAINSKDFKKFSLPLILGVDVTGKPVLDDLVKMPHLLIGGSTGSGKSVGLHSIITGLLCLLNPDQAKLILIDPKRLEFGMYADLPHLFFPIVTSADAAIGTLKWVVQEMERRYLKMASAGARNISEYQELIKALKNNNRDDAGSFEPMPFLILVIDELADLMMVGGKDLEMQIVRLAQMARAAGIHIIVATQRPSVEVVTGLIKVNFPSRISFRVSSKIDSRTVLDGPGAEKLLGRGDLLFKNSSSPDLLRAHGAYISDAEIKKVVDCWKAQQAPKYLDLREELKTATSQQPAEIEDEIYDQVIEFIQKNDEISISLLQRYFRIGFNRSARLIEKLELDGLISPAQTGSKTRKVLR